MEKDFMMEAITEAKKSKERVPCGAVIAKNGQIISRGYNNGKTIFDATGHAEINAIRTANKKLSSKRLEGCEIYCTCEPCIMCLSAIASARIGKIYYGLSLKDISPLNKIINISLELFLRKCPHKIEVVRNFLEEECKLLQKQKEFD